jgi:poly-gamma-glutamate synthesis protein (capsule biosynthesis protein)
MRNGMILTGDFVPKAGLDPYDPFSDEIRDLFHESEYAIINLETPLTDRGKPILKTGKNFRRNPKYAEILKQAGVDCVCLANNHIRDYGDEGVLDTIRYCKEAGLDIVGAGINSEDAAKPLIKEFKGMKVGFLNYCEWEFSIASEHMAGANPFDIIDAVRQIKDLQSAVDRIVVIYHGGIEYQHYPTREMIKNFRFLVENGVDAVFVHHAHAYSGYEVYRGKLIQYGLGNLLAASDSNNKGDDWLTGLMFQYCLDQSNQRKELVNYRYLKMDQNYTFVDFISEHEIKVKVSMLNEFISDPAKLQTAWDETTARFSDYYLTTLSSNTRLGYMMRKHFKLSFRGISRYRLMVLLNCMRCQSLRNLIIEILHKETLDVK